MVRLIDITISEALHRAGPGTCRRDPCTTSRTPHRLEEDHLRNAFVRIDLGRQRRRVRKLERDVTFPLGFERRDVHNDAAARISRFPEADREDVSRNAKVLNGACERETVRRNDADVAAEIDERSGVECLRIDDRRVDVREDLEFVRAANVVTVARRSVRHDPAPVRFAHLAGLKRLDHSILFHHTADPFI